MTPTHDRGRKFRSVPLCLLVTATLLAAAVVTSITVGTTPVRAETNAFDCADANTLARTECWALEDFYDKTDGPYWTYNATWNAWLLPDSDPCRWWGVTCADNHVVALNLRSAGLRGSMPEDVLAEMPYLVSLNLASNELTGSIPMELANLPNLHQLSLADNRLSGSIPEGLLGDKPSPTGFTRNEELFIDRNMLNGELPIDLGNDNLQVFGVGINPDLGGPIPTTYAQLPRLSLAFAGSQVCIPWDEATLAWQNTPLHSFHMHPFRCSDGADLTVRVAQGTVLKQGIPIGGEEPVNKGDQLGIDVDAVAEVLAECDLKKNIILFIIETQVNFGINGYEFKEGETKPDLGTMILLSILESPERWIKKYCRGMHSATLTSSNLVDAVSFFVDGGGGQLHTVDPEGVLNFQTPHAVVQTDGPVHLEIGVDPNFGTFLTMLSGSATVTPSGGTPQKVESGEGIVVGADEIKARFEIEQIYLPYVIH